MFIALVRSGFRGGLSKSLYGSFLLSIVTRGLSAAIALTANVVLARLLGVSEYGRYMAVYSAALILAGLAVRGSDQLLTRELSSGAGGEPRYRAALWRWTVRRVAPAVLVTAIAFLAWSFWGGVVRVGGADTLVAFGGLLLVGIYPVVALLSGALNGHHASQRSQLLAGFTNNLVILVLLGILWAVHVRHFNAAWAVWLQVAGYIACCMLGWFWLRRAVLQRPATTIITGAPVKTAYATAAWSSAARSFFAMAIAALVANRLDVVLVSTLGGNEDAGVYIAGARLAQVALLVALAVNVVLSPRISAAWSRDDRTRVWRVMRSGLFFTVVVAVSEVLIAVFLSRDIVKVFGDAYSHSAPVFVLVVIAYALWTLAAPGYALLAMTGSEKIVARVSWLIATTNVIAILILVPIYGAVGGGVAMIAGFAISVPIIVGELHGKFRTASG